MHANDASTVCEVYDGTLNDDMLFSSRYRSFRQPRMVIRVEAPNSGDLLRHDAILCDVDVKSTFVLQFRRPFGHFTDDDDSRHELADISRLHVLVVMKNVIVMKRRSDLRRRNKVLNWSHPG